MLIVNRGWLTSVNGADLGNSNTRNVDAPNNRKDLFGFDLLYNNSISALGNTQLYNGNISAMRWSNNLGLSDVKEYAYKFDYDPMNRLTSATQKKYSISWTGSNAYQESGLAYDLNGNIRALIRTNASGVQMDSLKYNYGTGDQRSNRLLRVNDGGLLTEGFVDAVNMDYDYVYDDNGNMTVDKNKSIQSISYNYLNLPEKVTKTTGDYLVYTYDATGRKLIQDVYSNTSVLKKRSDYHNEWFLENDTLRFVNHEEGRAVVEGAWVQAPQMIVNSTMASPVVGTGAYDALSSTLAEESAGANTYLKVTSNTTVSSGVNNGVAQNVFVKPGQKYTVRIKGYRTGSLPVSLIVINRGSVTSGGGIVYPGGDLPLGASSEKWVEATFTAPSYTDKVTVAAMWRSGVDAGDVFYLNDMELYEYNTGHGNQVFATSGYTYQYHLKDHLGNVRMTFTTKDEVDSVKATMELSHATQEASSFLNYNTARFVYSSLFDRTNGSSPGYSERLSGSPSEQTGLAKTFSVMPGDIIKAQVYVKYFDKNASNLAPALGSLLSSLLNPAGSGGVVIDGGSYGSASGLSLPAAEGFNDDDEDVPNAYLAYIYMNREYDASSTRTRWKALSVAALEDGTGTGDHELLTLIDTVKEAGYVSVYLRNDEMGSEVYFDDFEVEHIKSPVIQSDDYYAFGLRFNSYSRENSLANQYQYNDKEVQDELNLGWLDYGARMYMSELGRWTAIDPKSDKYSGHSPYNYVTNNPMILIDPNGMEVTQIEGGYRYTEGDAKALFSLLQGNNNGKKNAYFALIGDKSLRENTNNTAVNSTYNGQWSVFAAANMEEATFVASFMANGSLDNAVFETHGGRTAGKNKDESFLLLDATAEAGNRENTLTNGQLAAHLEGTGDHNAAHLQSIMNKIADNGNLAIAACFIATGANGEAFLRNLIQLSGSRINILGSSDLTRYNQVYTDKKYSNHGIITPGSLSSKAVETPQWKMISTDGKIYHYSDVMVQTSGNPLVLKR